MCRSAPPPPGTTASGCAASDFAGFPAGNIALVQRGTCNFGVKAKNAEAAGAARVVVFNEGQPGREAPVAGTSASRSSIPVMGTTYALGVDTVTALRGGQTVDVARHHRHRQRDPHDLQRDRRLALGRPEPHRRGQRPQRLGRARARASTTTAPAPRWTSSSPDTRHGGTEPAQPRPLPLGRRRRGGPARLQLLRRHLTAPTKAQIIAMLDFDMVASPNYARQVYDGDGSTFGPTRPVPTARASSRASSTAASTSQDQAHEPIPFDGRSDYVAFTNAGIPAGGIFTGAEEPRPAEQQAMFGGTEGAPLDPCYHQACDTFDNLNLKVLGQMKDAAADVLYQLALTRTRSSTAPRSSPEAVMDRSRPRSAWRGADPLHETHPS